MHYYQWNIGDYHSHTNHLTPIEDICYRRLLDYYYLHEKPIPNDIPLISRKLRLNECSTDVERVLNEYFMLDGNVWINRRANEVINEFHEQKKKASEAGKASAKARLERSLNGSSNSVEPTINHKPLTKNQEPLTIVERATAKRLPADWLPTKEQLEFCKKERPELNPQLVADRFRDHWIAEAGAKARKLDWNATWRNWVRNERSANKSSQDKSPPRDWI